ncbi:hypothetical protein F5972_16045 [Microbispora cellulosiformans]|uniref:Lipoprotein n=1 Tax=Microbispora cellulosiformans TaxID=2614688 RepID=A0A5J5K204_9ACTN|nr:hypothetical protein [Microbispora cellulosiformans]KAA9378372.1 hypothetical protein F5972_16045 [Microbispora cellulosiformans]
MAVRAMVVVCLALIAAGCASAEKDPVVSTAERFLSAAGQGQGGPACRLLSPKAARSLDDCEKQIVSVGLRPAAVRGVDVWGDEARVRLDGDTLFLHRFSEGWRIRAAGCAPRPGEPYECEVEA